MSLFEKKYTVVGWNGDIHTLSAKALYERVLADSKSDYNWIASATELVKVCNSPSFPEMYAQAIKIIILNCFANLDCRRNILLVVNQQTKLQSILAITLCQALMKR